MLLYICPKRIKPIFVPTAKYMLANNKRKVCDFLFSLVYCIFKCNNSQKNAYNHKKRHIFILFIEAINCVLSSPKDSICMQVT